MSKAFLPTRRGLLMSGAAALTGAALGSPVRAATARPVNMQLGWITGGRSLLLSGSGVPSLSLESRRSLGRTRTIILPHGKLTLRAPGTGWERVANRKVPSRTREVAFA